jgi:putative acetyltransferase
MSYAGDARQVFVLAPVAVATDRQGQGVGTALIRHGLDALRARGVDVALTYGDPAYYGRIGFRPITTEIAAAPYPLQFPHGWLGQALDGGPLRPLVGEVACVPALADPAFW